MKEFLFKIGCRNLEDKSKQVKETIVKGTDVDAAIHRLEKCQVTVLDYLGSRPITRANLYHGSLIEQL